MKNDKLIEIIKEAEQKRQQPNKTIDSYRCYWEGRLSLAKELLEAEQESSALRKVFAIEASKTESHL